MSSHRNRNLRSKATKNINGTIYTESCGLPPGILPTHRDVAESMLYLLRPERAGKNVRKIEDAADILSHALRAQWEFCTVYTIAFHHIKAKIISDYKEFRTNYQYREKKKTPPWKSRMVKYNHKMNKLFDIFCHNETARKAREEEVGVSMGDAEFSFLEDMRTDRKQYCDDFIDKLWQREKDKEERRTQILKQRAENLKKAAEKENQRVMSVLDDDVMSLDSSTSVLSKLSISTRDVISSTSSISDDDTVAVTATPKKRKMNEGITGNNQLHPDLQHVRKKKEL